MISLGGVDGNNLTTRILEILKLSNLPTKCEIKVILGSSSPWKKEVLKITSTMPWNTEVIFGTNKMAEFMMNSDLAIGLVEYRPGNGAVWVYQLLCLLLRKIRDKSRMPCKEWVQ